MCPDGYVKCADSYCVAVGRVCDGEADCPAGEDEGQCGRYRLCKLHLPHCI